MKLRWLTFDIFLDRQTRRVRLNDGVNSITASHRDLTESRYRRHRQIVLTPIGIRRLRPTDRWETWMPSDEA